MYRKVVTLALGAMLSTSQVMASNVKEQMVEDLQFLANRFKTSYAPIDWKMQHNSWDVNTELELAKQRIYGADTITVNEYQAIVKDFLDSSKDYHVGYMFYHTEQAYLPFTVKGVDGKYFISHVYRDMLPESVFPFDVGDEVVEFGGVPTHQAVLDLYNTDKHHNVEATDMAIAELVLTSRTAMRLNPVPSGPINVKVKRKDSGLTTERQLIWHHEKEQIQNHLVNARAPKLTDYQQNLVKFTDFQMSARTDLVTKVGNPYGLGNRESFLPELGTKKWESDSYYFQAYSYKHASGKTVGYLRIPSYSRDSMASYDGSDVSEFADIVKYLEKNTDALVIDQLNNPGGSVFYLYGLASMLTTQPLKTPKHEMSLNQELIYQALDIVNSNEGIPEMYHELISNIIGYPYSSQFMEFEKNYAQFLIDEWNAGKTRTSPYHIAGVDHINPHSEANYSKPILILTNELDFSGGDFFPAIMQDNKRATVMGTRTAGAGGYISMVQYENVFGLQFLSYTASIAERLNKEPIENLGVTPDVEQKFTPNDLANDYVDYIKAVNNQVDKMLETPESSH